MKFFPPALLVLVLSAVLPSQWPTWRGVDGTGAAPGEPPLRWSEDENIRWKVAIPGRGHASPIIWKDRLYVATAIATDRKAEPVALEPQDDRSAPRPTVVYEFGLIAIDRADGSVVWQKTLAQAVPHEGGHATNSQASSSPVTDGEHLFVNFGSRGLYCLTMAGEVVWEKDFGLMRTRRQYGEGSSPALFGDMLILNWDHEGDSFIAAFDKSTGEQLWRRDRDEVTSWATPIVVTVDGSPQVVINATQASRGYDLASGETIWSLPGMTVNCIPTPIHEDGVVYMMSGYRGAMLQAVRLSGAEGELEGTDSVLWRKTSGTSYVPSGLLYRGNYYYLRGMNGVLNCVDARTGEFHYEGQRLGLQRVYSSPVAANGHVYITSRDGVTKVLKAGNTYEVVAENRIDDGVDATFAFADDEIYLRGTRSLYCIAKR